MGRLKSIAPVGRGGFDGELVQDTACDDGRRGPRRGTEGGEAGPEGSERLQPVRLLVLTEGLLGLAGLDLDPLHD